MENDKHIISVVDVWQSQSYWPLNGWGAPNKSLGSTPHFWVPSMQIASDVLPEALAAPNDWTWTNQWAVDKSHAFGAHDADGWYYGPSFERLAEIIQKRSGADVPSKTSLVRRRRWMRTMRCSSEEILEQISHRIEKVSNCRKNIEHAIREKEESLRSIQFYEENRAFVFDQSLGLATQGTVATMTVLKELFFKLKRLHQFITERAQVELEYSAKIESLGFKYSNSITQEAQNPLLASPHHTPSHATAQHAPVDVKGTPQSSAHLGTAVAGTPSTLRSSFASLSSATGRLGMAGVSSLGVLSATKATPISAPAHKDGISPLMEDMSSDMDTSAHGADADTDGPAAVVRELDHEPDNYESTYLNRDASAVLFNSLAAVHITAAERMKQFSKTMKHAAVTELEGVLTQIAKLLKEAKATFRKNSDICQLCDGAARKCFDSAVEVLESAVSASTAEMLELVDEMSALKGNIPTTSAFNTAALSYTTAGSAGAGAGGLGSGSTHGTTSRRTSFISSPAPVQAPKGRQDTWLSIQRYRQSVRDSQEAMCVLITEYMDLELHQQILCNKVYALFLSLGKTYHREQTALWEESLQIFGNLLGDTIGRIDKMGRPIPVLQSPFVKLQAAEEAHNSAPSTPVKDRTASRATSPGGKGGRTAAEIQYEDFAACVGVFSFVVLYKDPLPICPSVCLSGEVLVAKGRDFLSSKGDVLSAGIWKTVYAVVTSDGYLHILSRGKCDIPDVSFCIKRCVIQSFSTDAIPEPYAKVVLAIKPTAATETQVKNGAQKGEDYYLRLGDPDQLAKWRSVLLDPSSAPIYVDTDIEEETKQAMLRSIAIIRGETEKIDLSLNKYTADLMVPSLAAATGAPVFATPSSTKYDAFKHRSFIYDDEEEQQIDASAAMTPKTHLVGRARRDTADSLNLDFAQSTIETTEGQDEAGEEGDDAQDEQDDTADGDGEGDGDEEPELEGVDEADEEGGEEDVGAYDPDGQDDQQSDDGEEQGDAGEQADGSSKSTPESGDAVPTMAATSSPGKTTLYKLSGQHKTRVHKEPKEHRPLPHTSSGHTLGDKQGTEISAYKFGSQYLKGGDSWVKKETEGAAGSTGAAAGKGRAGPKQIIPVADNRQPLARRHSSMINQYETGLQEEKKKVEHRVKETKRRMIQDVVNRVILEGDEHAAKQLDASALLEDPASAVAAVGAAKNKKVKEIAGKFGASASQLLPVAEAADPAPEK